MDDKKILIVDDEKEICLLLSAFLKSQGFKTSYATSIAQGRTMIKEVRPEIVFLDINLPDGEGFELVENIREKKGAIVIIISAREGEKELRLAKEFEVEDYLTKPFTRKDVVNTLQKFTQL